MGMSRKMIETLGLILILLLSDPYKVEGTSEDNDYNPCEHVVRKWASSSVDTEVSNDKHVLRNLLFFLHIPRTGGRTYLHCFLKKLYSDIQECPRSYDKLRFDASKPNCRLISTHDDYSVMSKFPREETSVLTILRKPLDRVFSTYEFSVEVAARFLIHPNITSVAKAAHIAQDAKRKTSVVSTLDIWPWKYLVPWMREDLFARRDVRRLSRLSHQMTNNSYDMGDFVMPLHEYINDPMVQDIVHNGATFQITGLTNNSYTAEAHDVRHCVLKHHSLGKHVLEVAKKRLDKMLYVGLIENHEESATMFANAVGSQVISLHSESSAVTDVASHDKRVSETKTKSSFRSPVANSGDQGNNTNMVSAGGKVEERKNMTVRKLIEEYETCISSLRRTQSQRRLNSLKQISPVNFTKEARKKVPSELIQEIKSMNSLDIQLYKYAEGIFTKHRMKMRRDAVVSEGLAGSTLSADMHFGLYDSLSCSVLFLFVGVLLLLLSFYAKSWRRTSKLKL